MERLQSTRVWVGGGGLVALLVLGIGWFVFIGPQLSSAGELRDQAAATRETNERLQLQVRSLQAKSTKLEQYTSSLNEALAALPYDSGLPAFTRQLNRQALANGATVSSVTVGGVAPVEVATPPAPAPEAATGGAAATTPAPGAAAFAVQMTLQTSGSLRSQIAFLRDVRTGPRRALILGTQVTPGTGAESNSVDDRASLSTQLSIFSVPRTPDKIRQLKKLLRGDLGD